ncbi:type II toxin-antitoxin system HicB family antitoxin [Longimicrobium sp.]|uniref:type II toxin-antitoxin system HicB family antitoxin n=1 Tax=Longimicrobium sp. TaxID=2029185 RepID=UPI003B3AE545
MHFHIEVEREEDGRWIAEVPELPGVIVYGEDRASAVARAQELAVRVLAERLEDGGMEDLQERALRASHDKYETALAEVPHVQPELYDRLKKAAALLDPAEERALAEEGLAADFEAWPEYSDEDCDHQSQERESEITARLDEIYATEESRLDAALLRAQRQSVDPDN